MFIAINKYNALVFSETCEYVNNSIVHRSQIVLKVKEESELREELIEYVKKAYGKSNYNDIAFLSYEVVDVRMEEDYDKYNVKYKVVFDDDFWTANNRRKDYLYGFGDDEY